MTAEQASTLRNRGLVTLLAVVLLGLLAYSAWWYWQGRLFVSTDDAYVAGDIVQITSEVAGTVVAVHVDDTQAVRQAEPLVELDAADAHIALQAAEAELARAVRSVRALYAQGSQIEAQIRERRAALAQANEDLRRRLTLEADGGVSGEEISHARDAVTLLEAALAALQEQRRQTLAQTQGTRLTTHPLVLAAEANLRNAALALHRTRILAPVAGVVAKRSVQLGQRVAPGAPLMAVVPLAEVWVDANFKEGQLADLRLGQPVRLHADFYGDDVDFHGRVAGLAAGSGAAFALLPAQNASGNWIKIVQRLPVRIALDAAEVKAHPLRVGLSMDVEVDTRDRSGVQVAQGRSRETAPTQASDAADPAVDQRIAQIIAANAGDLAVGGAPQP